MWIKIKNDIIRLEEVQLANFDHKERGVVLFFKWGAQLLYGKNFVMGKIPQDRVISEAEFEAIKDFFTITQEVKVVA